MPPWLFLVGLGTVISGILYALFRSPPEPQDESDQAAETDHDEE